MLRGCDQKGSRPTSILGRYSIVVGLARLTLLLLLGRDLANLTHNLTAHHGTCTEHGELIELSESPAPKAPHSDLAAREQITLHTSQSHGLEHRHCEFDVLGSSRATQTLPVNFAFVKAARSVRAQVWENEPLLIKRPGFRIAPKNSPPYNVIPI